MSKVIVVGLLIGTSMVEVGLELRGRTEAKALNVFLQLQDAVLLYMPQRST
jgi:hypothetical protein